MSEITKWVREQRVPGGKSWASAMYRVNADAGSYIRKMAELAAKKECIELEVTESVYEFEVRWGEDIVWFGRDIDIDLLRTASAAALEELLEKRIHRLREFKKPETDGFAGYLSEKHE